MKYKTIKKVVPFCEKCQEEIQGNGSLMLPYRCSCGVWVFDFKEGDYYLEDK